MAKNLNADAISDLAGKITAPTAKLPGLAGKIPDQQATAANSVGHGLSSLPPPENPKNEPSLTLGVQNSAPKPEKPATGGTLERDLYSTEHSSLEQLLTNAASLKDLNALQGVAHQIIATLKITNIPENATFTRVAKNGGEATLFYNTPIVTDDGRLGAGINSQYLKIQL